MNILLKNDTYHSSINFDKISSQTSPAINQLKVSQQRLVSNIENE
jgi:hypothetical protein